MARKIVECVPNFSEGRDPAIIHAIAESIGSERGVTVLDCTMDADHNRSVITFAGSPASVVAAAVRAVGIAAQKIDLNHHDGVHPRIGAADVVPFVPLRGLTLAECAALAVQAGEQIWDRHRVPVYLYEAAARIPERCKLEDVRRGQFELLRMDVERNHTRRPDIGGPLLHPTAGATAVGARKMLIAYNVNLKTSDVSIANTIARRIRASSGGLPEVKALGMLLKSRMLAQVSMNLTDFETTPLHAVQEAIRKEAQELGVELGEGELIGLIPRAALERAAEYYLQCETSLSSAVLENRLESALEAESLEGYLDSLADPSSTVASGNAAAITGSMAAALGSMVCRLAGLPEALFEDLRQDLSLLGDRDSRAFTAIKASEPPTQESIYTATAIPVEVAEHASELLLHLNELRNRLAESFRPDLGAAIALAEASRRGAILIAKANLLHIPAADVRQPLEKRLQTVE